MLSSSRGYRATMKWLPASTKSLASRVADIGAVERREQEAVENAEILRQQWKESDYLPFEV